MSIVFSAILPHSPILIPEIGKDNTDLLKKTSASYLKLKNIINDLGVDTLFIISPHGEANQDSFIINLNTEYTLNLEEFGDFSIKQKYFGNIALAHKIKERLETKAKLQLNSQEFLDHGSAIPLYLLLGADTKIKIVPIYVSGATLKKHFEFGQLLQRELLFTNEKIGIIASGDLSHRVTKNSPHGYSSKGKKFDSRIIELIKNNKSQDILEINEKLLTDVGECGMRPISILFGILEGISHKPKFLSYEYPFGVGYLSLYFQL